MEELEKLELKKALFIQGNYMLSNDSLMQEVKRLNDEMHMDLAMGSEELTGLLRQLPDKLKLGNDSA